MNVGFGRHGRLLLYNTQQHAFPQIFYERALSYLCRTAHAELADLFLVPAYTIASSFRARCAESTPGAGPAEARNLMLRRLEAVRVANATPALYARGGRDHFLVQRNAGSNTDVGASITCELHLGDPLLANVTVLTQEVKADGDLTASLRTRFFSTPYPSFVHVNQTAPMPAWRPGAAHVNRTLLVGCAFAPDHAKNLKKPNMAEQANRMQQLRHALLRSCIRAGRTRCEHLLSSNLPLPASTSQAMEIARLHLRATFCLQPIGDSFARKGIIDSLVLGCIPVLFHQASLAQWPWHWGSWRENATIMFDERSVVSGETDVVAELERIDSKRIVRMQATIAANAHRMQYASVDASRVSKCCQPHAETDAFEVALGALWQHSHL